MTSQCRRGERVRAGGNFYIAAVPIPLSCHVRPMRLCPEFNGRGERRLAEDVAGATRPLSLGPRGVH